jgi:hypothetical protein
VYCILIIGLKEMFVNNHAKTPLQTGVTPNSHRLPKDYW